MSSGIKKKKKITYDNRRLDCWFGGKNSFKEKLNPSQETCKLDLESSHPLGLIGMVSPTIVTGRANVTVQEAHS